MEEPQGEWADWVLFEAISTWVVIPILFLFMQTTFQYKGCHKDTVEDSINPWGTQRLGICRSFLIIQTDCVYKDILGSRLKNWYCFLSNEIRSIAMNQHLKLFISTYVI